MGTTAVGLEVGTSKVCAAVGYVGSDGSFSTLGLGQRRSRGVRKGEIVDPARAVEDIRVALEEAENMADFEIREIYLGVTGAHIRTVVNQGICPILSDDRAITEEDLQDAVQNAKAHELGPNYEVLHTVRQSFSVDDMHDVQDPVNMVGSRVGARVHFTYGNVDRLRNARRVIESMQLRVVQPIFCGLGTTMAVLDNDAKDEGALVIDIGGGTTEYVLYGKGLLRKCGVFAVGGDHVSNDLAIGLKLPLGRAELLKIEHGAAVVDDSCRGAKIALSNDVRTAGRTINLEYLRRIQSMRVEEILELVAQEVGGDIEMAASGVYLCGGGALTPGIIELAERVFRLPARIGSTQGISGVVATLDRPEFATAIGLAMVGAMRGRRRPPGLFGGLFGRR